MKAISILAKAVEKKMKRLYQLVTLCAFILACGAGASAQAAELGAAVKAALERDAVCTACHNESWPGKPILAYYQTRHGNKADARTPGCRTCHGQSDKHLESPANSPDVVFSGKSKPKSSAEDQTKACQGCHSKDPKRMHWQGSTHQSRDVTCATCHDIHAPTQRVMNKSTQAEVCYNCHKTIRAQTHRISTHPIAAGKVVCSDCHNPHGTAGPKLMKEDNVRDTCFTCHAEKRGPFLHEHASAMDDCMNCHTPHGSTNATLLKARMPWLCQECHADSAPHPGSVYSGNNLPGGAQANANQTGGMMPPLGSGGTFRTPTPLGVINPVTGAPITSNAGSPQIMMRGCVNCHSQIHGSNHPGGQRFTR